MTKAELQEKALSLVKSNHRIALQWCTGLGKKYNRYRFAVLQSNL